MDLRHAELVAGHCLASDLGKGLDDGQGLRACALAMDLAAEVGDEIGLDEDDLVTLYWVALLRFVGCTVTATDVSSLADELAVSAAFASADTTDLRDVVRRARVLVGSRPDRLAGFLTRAAKVMAAHEVTSCEVAQSVAAQLDLPSAVVAALGEVFERYDGRAIPGGSAVECRPR